MIANILKFLEFKINEFIKIKVKLDDCVVVSDFTNEIDESKILISLVNIEEELALSNRVNFSKQTDLNVIKSSPVFLNLYILVSIVSNKSAKAYVEHLSYLSLVIQFFQSNNVFLEATTKLPKGVSKLTFETVNLSIDNMSRFWGAIGEKYRPSMIYKIRMIEIDDNTVNSVVTPINEPVINVKK